MTNVTTVKFTQKFAFHDQHKQRSCRLTVIRAYKSFGSKFLLMKQKLYFFLLLLFFMEKV